MEAVQRTGTQAVFHNNQRYMNNREEDSYKPTWQRQRARREIHSPTQAQRYLGLHGITQHLFRPDANIHLSASPNSSLSRLGGRRAYMRGEVLRRQIESFFCT